MTEGASPQGSVAFHDVAIYFSQVEWKLLEEWQKELYKNVIKEIHGTLISMGYSIHNPGILFRIDNEEKPDFKCEQESDGDGRSGCPNRRRHRRCHPDILLRIEEDHAGPHSRDRQDSDGDNQLLDPPKGCSSNDPDTLFKIKEVDDSYFLDRANSDESGSGSGSDSPMTSRHLRSDRRTSLAAEWTRSPPREHKLRKRTCPPSGSIGTSRSSALRIEREGAEQAFKDQAINTVTIKQEEEDDLAAERRDAAKRRDVAERRDAAETMEAEDWTSVAEMKDDAESPSDLSLFGESWTEWHGPKYESSARHASVSMMEIDILEANRSEVSTKRHTKWAVSIFKGWLAEKHLDISFETISKAKLNKILREFFATVRNSSGKQYSISSYAGLRAGINRYFNDTRRINIVKDPEFTTANNVFIGVMKCLRKQGKDVSEHNPRISDRDLQTLKSSPVLSTNTARGLVSKVWFDVQFYFARRGQEGHRDLMPHSFKINRDEQGIEYVTLTFNDKNRHHPSQVKTNKENVHGCMYALPGNPLCPVTSFKKYVSKLPDNSPAFYLHPIKVRPELLESQPVWYTKEPLGINYLRRMMPSISQEAGLSLRYTNHSIWSTVVHLLSNSGLQARHIMSGSGHKKEVSIGRYWAESAEDRKRLVFLVPVAAPSTSSVDRGLLPIPRGLGSPVQAESTQPSS